MYLQTTVLLALAASSYGSPADADIPTDPAALESLLNDPGVQASLSAALNSLSSYIDGDAGLASSISGAVASFVSGDHDTKSDASSTKAMAATALGVSLFAALF